MRSTDCIVPLLGVNGEGRPELIGSGILVEIGSKIFLLTATHIFTDNPDTTIYFLGASGIEELSGVRNGAPRNEQDVSVVLLEKPIADSILRGYHALPAPLIEMNDVTHEGQPYYITGFSEDVQSVDLQTSEFQTRRIVCLTAASDTRAYRKCQVSHQSHIIIGHSKNRARDSSGNSIVPPSPHCMSGGGVWKYLGQEMSTPGIPALRLAGVIIEKHKTLGVLIATRINFPIEIIRSEHPELAPLIPTSFTLTIRGLKNTEAS